MTGASAGYPGLPGHDDRTHVRGFRRPCAAAGIRGPYHAPGCLSANHADQVFPPCLADALSDALSFALGAKALASHDLWLLQKPEPNGADAAEPVRLHARA